MYVKMEEEVEEGYACAAPVWGGQYVASDTRPKTTEVKREPSTWEESHLAAAGGTEEVSKHCNPRARMTSNDTFGQDVNKDGGAQGLKMPVGIKTPKYAGKSDWEAFHAQFELLAQASGWSDDQKALQLALCLTDEALSCLLLLDPCERASYRALTGALERRFGQCFRSELLRSELHTCQRRGGEPLRALANDIEGLTRRAYAHMPTTVQTELARDQFIRALSPPDLRVHTQLARPQTLTDALEYALEREMVMGAALHSAAPLVRATGECEMTAQRPAWVDEVTEMIRGLALPPNRQQRTQPGAQPRLCWGCGQAGHLKRKCPALAKDAENGEGSQ